MIGSGTKSDPYDGGAFTSKPFHKGFISRFDAIMHLLTTRQAGRTYEIILGPGVFLTQGDYSDRPDQSAGKGFLLQPNTTVRGAGMGATTIKYMGWGPVGQIHAVICAGDYSQDQTHYRLVDYDNITVEDLTIDCNATGLDLDPNAMIANPTGIGPAIVHRDSGVCIYGVALSGTNSVIRNVEVINAFGIFDDIPNDANGVGFESFAISISAHDRDSENVRIEGCSVRDPVGDYVDGIVLSGSMDGKSHCSGVVSGNSVAGPHYTAYGLGGVKTTTLSGNTATGSRFGLRSDTLTLTAVALTGNTFAVNESAFALKSSRKEGYIATNTSLVGNTFSASKKTSGGESANGVIDLDSNAPVNGMRIVGNTIAASDSSYPALYLADRSTYSDLVYSENKSSLPVENRAGAEIAQDASPQTPSEDLELHPVGTADQSASP